MRVDPTDAECDDRLMTENAASVSLDRIKERRERLGRAADVLELAVVRPAPDPRRWRDNARVVLAELSAALEDHVQEVEAEGGLFDDIATRTPRLIHAVDVLRGEHLTLAKQIAELRSLLGDDDSSVASIRDGALVLLAEISRHRHRGADLLWDSYNVDIGPGD
jgi:hypothetical protein